MCQLFRRVIYDISSRVLEKYRTTQRMKGMDNGGKLTIIVPCYNEEKALLFLWSKLKEVLSDVFWKDVLIEFIFVDDGSKDHTLEVIKEMAAKDKRVYYLSFSRNFGKEAAIYAGLQKAEGDYVVIMDADMQDPPELLQEMYTYVAVQGYDSAATRRSTRKGEPIMRSFFARKFYKIMQKISNTDMMDGARDFRMMNRKFVNALLDVKEYHRFTKGLFGWVGFRTKWLEYTNVERIAGKSKWSFLSLLKYSIEGITAFSTVPLVISAFAGIFMCMISVFSVLFVIVRKLLFGDPVTGWASLVCIITIIGGIELLVLGIVGEYMAKMYLEIKERPIYIISEDNFDDCKF